MAIRPNGYPRQYRLTKTDEFSSVFGFKRALKSTHFLLHYRPRAAAAVIDQGATPATASALAASDARLGLVIGKRLLPRSVDRNLVKRLAREAFRTCHGQLPACDVVLRLAVKPGRPQRQQLAQEMRELLQRLVARLAREGKTAAGKLEVSPS